METETSPHTKSLADWLPELNELRNQEVFQSTKKKPKNVNSTLSTTAEKFKPLKMSQLNSLIGEINGKSTAKKTNKVLPSNRKIWNSSVKLDGKKIKHIDDGQMKKNPVKKVLNFHTQAPSLSTNTRKTTFNNDSSKFPKPQTRPKKSLYHHQAKLKENVRISGVYRIPETPVTTEPKPNSRFTIANKENVPTVSSKPKYNNKEVSPVRTKQVKINIVPDTPLSNDSWKSSCDASFLQKEKEINDNLGPNVKEVEISPIVSTPFKDYRNVDEYFDHSSDLDSTTNNTIMCFEKSVVKEVTQERDDTVISSLCDMFNKATVTNSIQSEVDILQQMKRDTEKNINIYQNLMKTELKLLKYINELIDNKENGTSVKTLIQQMSISKTLVVSNESLEIKTTTTGYKIPRKNSLRKKTFHKSMPDMSKAITPKNKLKHLGGSTKALDMYMNMKETMGFLNTPVVKPRKLGVPDTPAVTSHNLQVQLDKLFNGS